MPPKPKNIKTDKSDSMGGLRLDEGFYGSPRWTYEILDCAMPMTFDTYSNCAHQCLYCFSFFQRAIGDGADDYLHHKVRAVNVEKVKRMFTDPSQYGGQFATYIKKRMVLQWGGLSDGFDWYEKKFGTSLDLLTFWNSIDYPLSISTKGVWWVDDPRYIEQVQDQKNLHWKYSIITSNEDHAKRLEPGTPPTRKRFEAMYKLNKMGVGATTLRFRPFVLGTSDKCIEEMMQMAEDAGCYSVTTEFLTWESRASNTSRTRLDAMSKVLGYDIWDFYMKHSARASGLLRLNYDLKRPYILEMKEAAERHNLKFFVSDAHHKEESYHAGCCGLPESGPLSNVNHGQYAHAIKIAKERGVVQWKDIKDEAYEILKDVSLYVAEGFPSDTVERAKRRYQSMFDYMHDIWNTPNSWQSPNRYFGGALVAGGVDVEGDVIYLYNKPFIEEGVRIGTANELAIQLRLAGKPNAERFDEMTADGTDYGHIAYPVYVISRKRWTTATTMKLLDQSRINYTLVVPPEDMEHYQEKFPNADIMVLPKGSNGVGFAREYVQATCIEQGYPYVWILDDDLEVVRKRNGESSTVRAMLSSLERWVEDYSNVALLGANIGQEDNKLFLVNEAVRGLMLVNLQTGKRFHPSFSLYEDYEFALKHIMNGWVTVAHNDFHLSFADLPGGGASGLYLQSDDAEALNKAYPEFTELEYRGRNVPPRIHIHWKVFTSSLRSRNVEALMKGE
jgi:DNA repair photolyase